MAITNYGELRAAVIALTDRGADVEAYIPDFVSLAEDTIFNGSETVQDPLRVRQMMAVADLTPTDGVCALPDDYLQYRRVVEKASIRRPLQFVTPDYADQEYPTRASGQACDFTIVGDNLHMFPLSSNDIELTYYQSAPTLVGDDSGSNWLLTKHPFLYLHAVTFHLAVFVKDVALAAQESGIVSQTIAVLNASSQKSEFVNAAYRPRGFFP